MHQIKRHKTTTISFFKLFFNIPSYLKMNILHFRRILQVIQHIVCFPLALVVVYTLYFLLLLTC